MLGEEHPDTLMSMRALGVLYRLEGRYSEADAMLTKALETQRRDLGGENPSTLGNLDDFAALRKNQGKYAEADALFASALETRRRVIGPAHPDTLNDMVSLAEVRLEEMKYADAESLLREALSSYEKTAPGSSSQYRSQSLLGASLAAQGRFAEAEPLLVEGYHGMTEQTEAIPFEYRPGIDKAGQRIVQLYERWEKPDKAAAWRDKLSQK